MGIHYSVLSTSLFIFKIKLGKNKMTKVRNLREPEEQPGTPRWKGLRRPLPPL